MCIRDSSDWVQNVADLGITADDYANSYQYNLDLGSDVDGNVRALFWQATPGCYAVRADLAEKYLGTTDPAALAEKFKDLDTIVATAKEVNDASGGKCKLFSGYDEIKRSLTGSRTQGFYDENDKITIDDLSLIHISFHKKNPPFYKNKILCISGFSVLNLVKKY